MGNSCNAEDIGPDGIKTQYFQGAHGRVEPIRLMLHHAGMPQVADDFSMAGWMMSKATGGGGEFGGLPIVHYKGQ